MPGDLQDLPASKDDASSAPAGGSTPRRDTRGRSVARGMVGMFAVIGALTVVVIAGLAAFRADLDASYGRAQAEAEAFAEYAAGLDGVDEAFFVETDAVDIMVEPRGATTAVRLASGPTEAEVVRLVETLRTWTADPQRRTSVHPMVTFTSGTSTVTVQVSADPGTTAQRLDLAWQAAADARVSGLAVTAPQPGDDPHPDMNNAENLTVQLGTPDEPGPLLADWSALLADQGTNTRLSVVHGDLEVDLVERGNVIGAEPFLGFASEPPTSVTQHIATAAAVAPEDDTEAAAALAEDIRVEIAGFATVLSSLPAVEHYQVAYAEDAHASLRIELRADASASEALAIMEAQPLYPTFTDVVIERSRE